MVLLVVGGVVGCWWCCWLLVVLLVGGGVVGWWWCCWLVVVLLVVGGVVGCCWLVVVLLVVGGVVGCHQVVHTLVRSQFPDIFLTNLNINYECIALTRSWVVSRFLSIYQTNRETVI